MRRHAVCLSALCLVVAACSADYEEATDPATTEVGNELGGDEDGELLAAPACPASTGTNPQHVSAGRAKATTTTFFIWRITTYYALGTNENLGTSTTARSTLYEISPGSFSTNVNRCPTGGGGSGGQTGSGGAPGSGGKASGGTSSGGTSSGGTSSGGTSSGGTSSGGTSGSGGSVNPGGPTPTRLPSATQACPSLTGRNGTDVNVLGTAVKIWSGVRTGAPRGPILIYWHATGTNSSEPTWGLGSATINDIVARGGIVAAQNETLRTGTNTGNGVWYTGDFAVADEIVACAIQQLDIDTRRIHASGFSAGGLQTSWMAYARSGYVASVVPYSGGILFAQSLQDRNYVPAAAAVHGKAGSDVVGIDFATSSKSFLTDIKNKGGFGVECDHGGGHSVPSTMWASAWRFMQDHPFGVKPSPYAGGLPSGFASYCKVY